jgi:predicted thioesterase
MEKGVVAVTYANPAPPGAHVIVVLQGSDIEKRASKSRIVAPHGAVAIPEAVIRERSAR